MENGLKIEMESFFYKYGIAPREELDYKWIVSKLLIHKKESDVATKDGLAYVLAPGLKVTDYQRYFPGIVPVELEKDYAYMLSLCTIDINSNKEMRIRTSYGNNFIHFINSEILTCLSSEWELYKIFAIDEVKADMARSIVTSHFSKHTTELIIALECELPRIVWRYIDEIKGMRNSESEIKTN